MANWNGLDEQAYRAKRDGWLDAIVGGIDRSFPGFRGCGRAARNGDRSDDAPLPKHP
jgi:hypothetical protein